MTPGCHNGPLRRIERRRHRRRELVVTAGNAGRSYADLTFADASTGTTTSCKYAGGSRDPFPSDPDAPTAGLRFELSSCDRGQVAGGVARASYFRLAIAGGDHRAGPTAVSLPLPLFR